MYYSKQIVIYTIMIIKQLDYREGSWRLERTSQHLTTATVKEPPPQWAAWTRPATDAVRSLDVFLHNVMICGFIDTGLLCYALTVYRTMLGGLLLACAQTASPTFCDRQVLCVPQHAPGGMCGTSSCDRK